MERLWILGGLCFLLLTGVVFLISSQAQAPSRPQIAFASYRDGNWEIYAMDVDGNNRRNVTNSPKLSDMYPAWSFDGQRIAFTTNPDEVL